MLNFISTNLNLESTLKPSFVLALMDRISPSEWRKLVGKYKGCIIGQNNSFIYSNADTSALLYWSGAWFNPKREFNSLKSSLTLKEREIIRILVNIYSDVSLSVNPFDMDLMIVPIVLSRRTSYERNVLNWCKRLWSIVNSLEELLKLDLKIIGRSYQLIQLKETLLDFKSKVIPRLHENLNSSELRLLLIECKHVGPKVADAYLLFTGFDVSAVPVDVHLINITKRLPLVKYRRLPSKEYCRKFTCKECPLFDLCLRATFTKKFKRLAGWLQTIFYLHDKFYCRKFMCRKCGLIDYCKVKES